MDASNESTISSLIIHINIDYVKMNRNIITNLWKKEKSRSMETSNFMDKSFDFAVETIRTSKQPDFKVSFRESSHLPVDDWGRRYLNHDWYDT